MSARALVALGAIGAGVLALMVTRRADAAIDYSGGAIDSGGYVDAGGEAGVLEGYAPVIEAPAAGIGAAISEGLAYVEDSFFQLVGGPMASSPGRWIRDAGKAENAAYVAAMNDAEARNGIPANLLVRQAWQESKFNPSAVNASGASGIMQIIPRWHPDVNVWDPFASIDYAAGYLTQQYRRFGSWELALKAYNWGPANVSNWLAGKLDARTGRALVEPTETKNYSRMILADVRATGQVIA